jgi:hypothetical protein
MDLVYFFYTQCKKYKQFRVTEWYIFLCSTFHFDADPDPDPILSLTHVEKSDKNFVDFSSQNC